MNHYKSKVHYYLSILTIFTIILSQCTCEKSTAPNHTKENNIMAVYPNSGNKITLVDCNTFEVVKQIVVYLPDTLGIGRMCLSTNKDYFVFIASTVGKPPFTSYIISYDIEKESIHSIFPNGLDSVGAPRLSAANLQEEPGLIYLYTHSLGLYSIDIFSKEVKQISNEYNQGLDKTFHFTSDKQIIVILKGYGYTPAHSEAEIYNTTSKLSNLNFTLNNNNRDNIYFDDLCFSADNQTMFISIRMEEKRNIENYFGSYNLQTKNLYKSNLTFPYSLNPYYLANSPKRNECYMVGAQDKFYIIGTDSSNYYLKDVVSLTGKVAGPSKILVRPDENVAFVSCFASNLIFTIDLENRQVIKKINIEYPYLMLFL